MGVGIGLGIGSSYAYYGGSGYYDPCYYDDGYYYDDSAVVTAAPAEGGDDAYCRQTYRSYDPGREPISAMTASGTPARNGAT